VAEAIEKKSNLQSSEEKAKAMKKKLKL